MQHYLSQHASSMRSSSSFASNGSSNFTDGPKWQDMADPRNQRFLGVQLVVSVTFGLSAFVSFCILRPRWSQLYSARKKQSQSAARLPDLPKSLLGWIPVVYNISREEVLAAAGLDAFAFLAFFRYAIEYLAITSFFALVVVLPVSYKYTGECVVPGFCSNTTVNSTTDSFTPRARSMFNMLQAVNSDDDDNRAFAPYGSYMWMYAVLAWFFTGIALALLIRETKYIIHMRQAYLGTQNTITDRTIRLSGVPADLRSEDKLKTFIQGLGIGKVDNIMICQDWSGLDTLMQDRMACLRRLEESLTAYLGMSSEARARLTSQYGNTNGMETTALLSGVEADENDRALSETARPKHTIRYGFLRLSSRQVDAIDYFEEKLRVYDEKIVKLRNQKFEPTALAYVTMQSTVACQMAVQTRLDPMPGQLLATPAPPPADVVWKNTYQSRNHRMLRAWGIMIVVGFLTVFWVVLLLPPASILSNSIVDKFFPGLKGKGAVEKHPISFALLTTTLPTLYFTLLSVGVPYLYDWMSNQQGMTSQSDVELSVVSKNFFFVFFNLFIVFTIFSTATQFYDFYKQLQDVLRDTSVIAYLIARSVSGLWRFYANLIILQGLGLMPFRLLEFGSVAVYPFYLFAAKTPRDHAELQRAPIFQYGFYLPQSMLIFLVCIVYSLLPAAWLVILFGLIYFCISHFIYKYQLLYAMEHQQHSTGRIWPMVCNRIILGLVIFQITMLGWLLASQALLQALLIAPLIFATLWFAIYFQRTYFPLMYFIALRSIDKAVDPALPEPSESAWDRATDRGRTVDTHPKTGLRYVNPNLVQPLEKIWIRKPVRMNGVVDHTEPPV